MYNNIEIPDMFQKFVNYKQLGDFSFYEISGVPLNVDTYSSVLDNGHWFYSEEYNYGSSGNYYQFYFMLLDYGTVTIVNIHSIDDDIDPYYETEADDEKLSIDDSSNLVLNRKESYPNTFGVCHSDYIKEVYEMISTFGKF